MTVPVAIALASGRDPGRTGTEAAMIAPYKAYRASDRYLVIAAGNDALFRRLAGVFERPEWASDPRFATNAQRVKHREALNAMIDAIVIAQPAAHWVEKLDTVGVPSAPLQSVSEVLAHEQTRALDMVRPVPGSELSLMSLPLRFDGERLPIRSAPPALGADNETVFTVSAQT
jgi:crotonobetainyl-CoA:carnitine CoA-transferase CaiB-like acyl-CoA transferase